MKISQFRIVNGVRMDLPNCKYGVTVPIPYVRLPDTHPCKGCVWYLRNASVLICPFKECVRYREKDDKEKLK